MVRLEFLPTSHYIQRNSMEISEMRANVIYHACISSLNMKSTSTIMLLSTAMTHGLLLHWLISVRTEIRNRYDFRHSCNQHASFDANGWMITLENDVCIHQIQGLSVCSHSVTGSTSRNVSLLSQCRYFVASGKKLINKKLRGLALADVDV